jgi:tetratricopeptide (TPR) repeat protein
LAVYYFGIGDLKRASGCLDKALKLRGGFELALVLAYHITSNPDEKLALVDKFMEASRSSAVSYFFKGLLMQQKKDFISAIDMFQNAMKFDTIGRQRLQKKNLLPSVTLPITENPFGIFGNQSASICWVYLSDCFYKIEKPNVALKCFTQAILEMSRLPPKESIEPSKDVIGLLEILNFEKFHPSELEVKNDPILKLLSVLKPQKWALECLLLGSKFVQTAQHSISILHVALKCLPASNTPTGVLAFILTEIIDKITSLVNSGVVIEDGTVNLYAESKEMIRRLQMLVEFCVQRTELDANVNLQKKILNALFIVSQRTQDEQSCLRAMNRADYLMTVLDPKLFQRTFLLDTCKIIHEYRRFNSSEGLNQKKISLLKQAIR